MRAFIQMILLPLSIFLSTSSVKACSEESFASQVKIAQKMGKKSKTLIHHLPSTIDHNAFDSLIQKNQTSPGNKRVLKERALKEKKTQILLNRTKQMKFLEAREKLAQEKFIAEYLLESINTQNRIANLEELKTSFQKILNSNSSSFGSYLTFVQDQVQSSHFRTKSQLKNVEMILDKEMLKGLVNGNNRSEFEDGERFFLFLKNSRLPLALMSASTFRQLLSISGGSSSDFSFGKIFKKIKKKFSGFFKTKDIAHQWRDFLTQFITYFEKSPLSVGLGLKYIFSVQELNELDQVIEESGSDSEKKDKNDKRKIIVEKLEQIISFFYHHPLLLCVLIFIIWHRKLIYYVGFTNYGRKLLLEEIQKGLKEAEEKDTTLERLLTPEEIAEMKEVFENPY